MPVMNDLLSRIEQRLAKVSFLLNGLDLSLKAILARIDRMALRHQRTEKRQARLFAPTTKKKAAKI